jgi:hypothetical protein
VQQTMFQRLFLPCYCLEKENLSWPITTGAAGCCAPRYSPVTASSSPRKARLSARPPIRPPTPSSPTCGTAYSQEECPVQLTLPQRMYLLMCCVDKGKFEVHNLQFRGQKVRAAARSAAALTQRGDEQFVGVRQSKRSEAVRMVSGAPGDFSSATSGAGYPRVTASRGSTYCTRTPTPPGPQCGSSWWPSGRSPSRPSQTALIAENDLHQVISCEDRVRTRRHRRIESGVSTSGSPDCAPPSRPSSRYTAHRRRMGLAAAAPSDATHKFAVQEEHS